jgi:hypothetical protein
MAMAYDANPKLISHAQKKMLRAITRIQRKHLYCHVLIFPVLVLGIPVQKIVKEPTSLIVVPREFAITKIV